MGDDIVREAAQEFVEGFPGRSFRGAGEFTQRGHLARVYGRKILMRPVAAVDASRVPQRLTYCAATSGYPHA
jgi:hypothetical protein